jgi:uncharacterized protein HemX
MSKDLPDRRIDSAHLPLADRPRGRGVVVALILVAVILAVAFFYMTKESRQDEQADKINHAAESVDRAAKAVGDAARNTADKLKDEE